MDPLESVATNGYAAAPKLERQLAEARGAAMQAATA